MAKEKVRCNNCGHNSSMVGCLMSIENKYTGNTIKQFWREDLNSKGNCKYYIKRKFGHYFGIGISHVVYGEGKKNV